MWNDSDAEFNEAADWYAQLAQKPGWLEHCRHAVQELEADSSGLYKGLRLAVRKRIDSHRAAMASNRVVSERPHALGTAGQSQEGLPGSVRMAGDGTGRETNHG